MIETLRTRLQAAEARRRNAESDVADLLAQILAEANVRLLGAERAGDDRWTLTVVIGADEIAGETRQEPQPAFVAPEPQLIETPKAETVQAASMAEVEEDEATADGASEAEESGGTPVQPAPAAPTLEEPQEAALPPLPELDATPERVSEEAALAADAEYEAATGEDPLLAPLPELPDFRDVAPVPQTTEAEPAPAAEPLPEPAKEVDDGLLLPPLPPLALLDNDDEVLAPDTGAAVAAHASEDAVELLGQPSAPPAPAPAPAAEEEPADLATLLRNGSKELRVKPTKEKRKNPFKQSSTDPKSRAERLARTLVSDMIAYGRERHDAALQQGVAAIRVEFEADIETARAEYYAQVDADSTPSRDEIFRKAVNDLLGNGQQVI